MSWGDWPKTAADLEQTTKVIEAYPLVIHVNLTIPMDGGWNTKTITAIQVGDLAVPGPDFDWAVVHVPTLTRFDNAVPDGEWTEEQLINWCRKVQRERRDLWVELSKYNNSDYKEINEGLLTLIKEHCLATPMED